MAHRFSFRRFIKVELQNALFEPIPRKRDSIRELLFKYIGLDDNSSEDINLSIDQIEKLKELDDNTTGISLLMKVTEFEQYDNIKFLIQCGVDVNHRDKRDKRAIDIACENGNYKAMLMLLEADSYFPGGIERSPKKPCIEKLEDLKNRRNELHKLIESNKTEAVRDFVQYELSRFLSPGNKSAQEVAAAKANEDTLAATVGLSPTLEIPPSEKQLKLLNQLNLEGKTIILIAAENNKWNNVEFLMRCGVELNCLNYEGKKVIDLAWDGEYYDIALKLLKADSDFPHSLESKLPQFQQNDDILNELKCRIDDFIEFHQLVKEGRYEKVENLMKTSEIGSKYYWDIRNQSAIITAIKNKRFKIYAFLTRYIDEQHYEAEDLIVSLDEKDKENLRRVMLDYFREDEKSHITYMLLTTKFKQDPDIDRIKKLYERLDSDEEIISKILKVIRYANNLAIIFDFDKCHTKGIDPTSNESEMGKTYSTGEIYIGGKRADDDQLLGTLAHEFTHLAMQMIYNNDCKPYAKVDISRKSEFQRIRKEISEIVNSYQAENNPAEIIARVFNNNNYEENQYDAELIVRIPHIIAQYGENGREFLENEKFQAFQSYFIKVLKQCDVYTKKAFLIRPRNDIKTLNKLIGEVNYIRDLNLWFDEPINLSTFLSDNGPQILILKSENTLLSKISIYRRLQVTPNYDRKDNYLILTHEIIVENKKAIDDALDSLALDLLIVEYPNGLKYEEPLSEILEKMPEENDRRENKFKTILIVADSEENEVDKAAKALGKVNFDKHFSEISDNNCALHNLKTNSRETVLNKKVIFQGLPTTLIEINENVEEILDAITLTKLIQSQRIITIGCQPLKISNSDGVYGKIYKDIPDKNLLKLKEDENNIYVIGLRNLQKLNEEEIKKELMEKFGIPYENIKGEMELPISNDDKVIFTASNLFEEDDFETFRQNIGRTDKIIYWINWKSDKFELQQIFDNDFYTTRNFQEIVIKHDIKELLLDNLDETFIFIVNDKDKFIKSLKFDAKQNDLFEKNCEIQKIQLLAPTEDLPDENKDQNLHLLKVKQTEKSEIIWINSNVSVDSISKYMDANSNSFVQEDEFVRTTYRKTNIIIDEPGMGKSTTLIKVARKRMETYWVIYINLRDCSDAIKKLPSSFETLDDYQVIEFLSNTNNLYDNVPLERKMIKDKLNTHTRIRPLAFFFDGFDEITDENMKNNEIPKKKVSYLLKYLKNKVNLWVTARKNDTDILFNCLSTFTIHFQEFDKPQQESYLKNFWRKRSLLTVCKNNCADFEEKLTDYVRAWLDKMVEVRKGPTADILGIPLHLQLLGEGFQNQFIEFILSGNESPNIKEFGLGSFYEHFIDKKYDIYLREKVFLLSSNALSRQMIIKSYDKLHLRLGFVEIFPVEATKFITNKSEFILVNNKLEMDNNYKEELSRIGLVQRVNAKKVEFIHRTFAEYFTAKQLVKWLIRPTETHKNLDVYRFILSTILENYNEYKVIRFFLNIELNKNTISIDIYNQFGNIIKVPPSQSSTRKYPNALLTAIKEENTGIVDFLLKSLKAYPEKMQRYLECSEEVSETVLHSLCRKNNLKMLDSVLSAAEEILESALQNLIHSINQSQHSALDIFLIYNKGTAIADMLFSRTANKLKLIIGDKEYKKKYSSLSLACRNQNYSFVQTILNEFEFDKDALKDLLSCDKPILACSDGKNIEILETMLRLAKSIGDKNETLKHILLPNTGNSPLNDASKYSKNAVEVLLKSVEDNNETLQELLLHKDQSLRTPLMSACKYGQNDVVKLLLDAAKSINDANKTLEMILLPRTQEFPSLYYASVHGNINIVKLLLEASQDIGDEKRTLKELLLYKSSSPPKKYACFLGKNADIAKEMLIATKAIADDNDTYKKLLLGEESIVRPLNWACFHQNVDMVNTLLNAAKDIQGDFQTLKSMLLQDDHELQKTFDMKHKKCTRPMNLTACKKLQNSTEVMKSLLEAAKYTGDMLFLKQLLLQQDENKETALYTATKLSRFKLVKLLLEAAATLEDNTLEEMIFAPSNSDQNVVQFIVDQSLKNKNNKDDEFINSFRILQNISNNCWKKVKLYYNQLVFPKKVKKGCRKEMECILTEAKTLSDHPNKTLKQLLLHVVDKKSLNILSRQNSYIIVKMLLSCAIDIEDEEKIFEKLLESCDFNTFNLKRDSNRMENIIQELIKKARESSKQQIVGILENILKTYTRV